MRNIFISILFTHLFLKLNTKQFGAKDDDLVQGLAGDGTNFSVNYSSPWYSGYLNPNTYMDLAAADEFKVHYVYFPSLNDEKEDPLILVLSDQLGCSTLIEAMFQSGPFIFSKDQDNNHYNKYSWNQNASVLYFDTLPGSGFSTTTNYIFSDDLVAKINYATLLAFYDRFDGFDYIPLFIASSGYGGVTVPNLALTIYKQSRIYSGFVIRLQGFILGNPATTPIEIKKLSFQPDLQNFDQVYVYQYLYNQGVISQDSYSQYSLNCLPNIADVKKCNESINQMQAVIQNLNIFNINSDCDSDKQTYISCYSFQNLEAFFSDKNVQNKMHVQSDNFKMCNDQLYSSYVYQGGSYYTYYDIINLNLYNIWIYSSDSDGSVPYTGTLDWIMKMRSDHDLADLYHWASWYSDSSKNQNMGSFWKMDGLNFMRIKGLGHYSISENPELFQQIIKTFLKKEILE